MTHGDSIVRLRTHPEDVGAWGVFYEHVRPRLLSYSLVLLASFRAPLDLADDVTQDALLSFLQRWKQTRETLESEDAAMRYLKKSVRNKLIDKFRSEQRYPAFVDFLDLRFNEAFGSEADIHRKIYLKDILGKLSGDCAKLLKRYVQEGLSLAELADAEKISPKTLYSQWYRCLEKAQKALSGVAQG